MQTHNPPVRRNQVVTLEIQALGAQGQGIGRLDGYAMFVNGALPGEQVRAIVIKPGARYGVGKLVELLRPSPFRVAPRCPHFHICGGCALQHLAYEEQLRYKTNLVYDALTRIGGLAVPQVAQTIGMQTPYFYRNKASFPFGQKDGRVQVGFFAPRSHRLVPVTECLLQKEPVMQAALCVQEWANAYAVPVYDEAGHKGLLRHVVARVGSTGALMVTIVATDFLKEKQALLQYLQARLPALESVYLNINRARTNAIFGDDYRLLFGAPQIEEVLGGRRFALGPASFLQVNHVQTEQLYACAKAYLGLRGQAHVVDAYCGIGTISLLVSGDAKEVVGIESVPAAVEDAARNAQQNGIGNVRFLCGAAEQALPKLLQEGFAPDALILDPPRKGADEAFLQAVIGSNIERVVYISCNPATLARDCKLLAAGGYIMAEVQPVDMFPQTAHVECVVLLTRTHAPIFVSG